MNIPALLMAVVFVLIPVSAARPMTSLFANQLGATMLEIGMITVCYSLSPLLLAVHSGRLTDRYGERMPVLLGALGIVISLALPYFFPTLSVLYGSQLLLGAGQLLVLVACQNGVARSAPPEKRDQAVGSFSFFSSIGLLIGPLVGGYASEHLGFERSYLFLSFIPLVSLLVALFVIRPPKTIKMAKKEHSGQFKDLLAIPNLRRAIGVSMIMLSAVDVFSVYFPLFAQSIGLSLTQIGWILTLQATANAMVRVFLPRLVQQFGRIKILWAFMSMGALSYGLIPFFHQFGLLAFMAIVLGTGLGVTQPLTIIISYNLSPPGRTGEVLGLRLASNRLAQTVIPFLLANLSNVIGLGMVFMITSLSLVTGAFVARGITERAEREEQSQAL